jgi:wyosine [tRNA(Phe)-imidazoG37] synthetase (radical SAM superfamily)
MQLTRTSFYDPKTVAAEVREHVRKVKDRGETIDYLTFVPDGEPTLDIDLGAEIDLLKDLGIKIAVITNGSLIWLPDVRNDLKKADWVSLKVDTTQEDLWRKTNRPHKSLHLAEILNGMLAFATEFRGELVTETMLVQDLNDHDENAAAVSDFLVRLNPACAYLLIPTRPPGEEWVKPPSEETVVRLYEIFRQRIPNVEYLIGYEGSDFGTTGNIEQDLLSITAVHPMREDAVKDFLRRSGDSWLLIDRLVENGLLHKAEYQGHVFYIRKFPDKLSY